MAKITEEQRERSRVYKESRPASVCECGHTGDGANSEHHDAAFAPGHNYCRVAGCSCAKFRWSRFRIPYLEAAGVK